MLAYIEISRRCSIPSLMKHDPIEEVFEYHDLSKHDLTHHAPGPGYLDWANQPNPFRRYQDAQEIPLRLFPEEYTPQKIIHPLTLDTISQLFQDCLGLSAWKSYQDSAWALRVNPSSGNLHPTEAYLISGPVKELSEAPMVAHYAPKEHLLEVRAHFPVSLWEEMTKELPKESFFVALTSIYWREAWKYGERAFRYCHHDAGHAIGTVAIAAHVLGWEARLLSHLGTKELQSLLGLKNQIGPDREHPDCCLVVFPRGSEFPSNVLESDSLFNAFDALKWKGTPNELSPEHLEWPWVEKMGGLTWKPFQKKRPGERLSGGKSSILPYTRQIIHQRRSAVAMDGVGSMRAADFYATLEKTLPVRGGIFDVLDWEPKVNFIIFVHRVEGLQSGLYFFLRNPDHLSFFKQNCSDYSWTKPEGCHEDLPLFSLVTGDARRAAKEVACSQDIAADGCFSLGMITEFEKPIRENGPWFYPRLFWESGLVGQVLYLEAEVVGIRSTGIGCFLDNPVHDMLNLKDKTFQSLYHFTVGHPQEDMRLSTLPPYSEELRSKRGFGRGS